MNQNSSPAPEFESDDDRSYFLIRLPVHAKVIPEENSPGNMTTEASEKASEKTSEKILSLMRKKPQITQLEIAETIDRSTRAIEMQVAKLKTEGLIERVGPDKGGHWMVKEGG